MSVRYRGSEWEALLLWLIYILQCQWCIFHVCERYQQLQMLMLWSGFSLGTDCIYNTSSHRAKLRLENMRDVPRPTIIYTSRQGETDKRLLKKRQIHPTSVISWDNISTLSDMKVLSSNRDNSTQLKNQSLWGGLVKEITTKITRD